MRGGVGPPLLTPADVNDWLASALAHRVLHLDPKTLADLERWLDEREARKPAAPVRP